MSRDKVVAFLGDPHAHPRYDNRRFYLLGKYLQREQIDLLHCVGDFTDWPSLNLHKNMAEARLGRYQDDAAAGNHALERLDDGLGGYKIQRKITLGNHDKYPEQWVAKKEPALDGLLRWDLVKYRAHGWAVTDFLDETQTGPFLCTHYFTSGVKGLAQGGIHIAYHNGMKQGMSCVVGHSHVFDAKIISRRGREPDLSFSAGCFVHPRLNEGWCKGTIHLWHRGLLVVRLRGGRAVEWTWVDQSEVFRVARR